MRRTCFVLAFIAGTTISAAALADPAPGLKITRIFPGGGSTNVATPFKKDFVEIKNTSDAPINTTGWSLQYQSAAGTTWLKADLTGRDVPPGGYYLVTLGSSSQTLAGANITDFDVDTTSVSLALAAGKLALVDNTLPLPAGNPCLSFGSGIRDFVAWGVNGNNCSETAPVANVPTTDTTIMFARNFNGCIDTDNNSNDFTRTTAAAPRTMLSPAEICGPLVLADASVTISSNAVCEVGQGGQVVYTVNAANAGPSPADSTVVTVTLPANATFVSANSGTGSVGNAGNVVTWTIGSLASGGAASLSVTATADSPGDLSTVAAIATTTSDPGSGNNAATAVNRVAMIRPLVVAKVVATNIASAPAAVREMVLPNGFTASFEASASATFDAITRPFVSADGRRFVFRANTDYPDGGQDDVIVAGQIDTLGNVTFAPIVQQGFTALDVLGTELIGASIDTNMGINNSGQVAFSSTTSAGASLNDVVVRYTPGTPAVLDVLVREGSPVPASLTLDPGINFGAANTARSIREDGSVAYFAQIGGGTVTTATDRIIARAVDGANHSLVLRKGANAPVALAGGETGVWTFFDDSDTDGYYESSDGESFLVSGRLATASGAANDFVVVENGEIVAQEGQQLPDLIPTVTINTGITTIPFVYLNPNGDGTGYGPTNDNNKDFVVSDETLTITGQPIVPLASEVWSDTAVNPTFAATFFLSVRQGDDRVIGGVSSQPDTWGNGVMVHNGENVVLREGDPVDLNGDGLPNDNAVVNTVRNDRAFIGADRRLYVVVSVRHPNVCAGVTVLGQALVSVALPASGPTGCNPADIATAGNPDPNAGPDGFLTGDDFDLFIAAFFNELQRPDNSYIADLVDGDGNPPPDGFLTGSDFDYFLSRFFEGC